MREKSIQTWWDKWNFYKFFSKFIEKFQRIFFKTRNKLGYIMCTIIDFYCLDLDRTKIKILSETETEIKPPLLRKNVSNLSLQKGMGVWQSEQYRQRQETRWKCQQLWWFLWWKFLQRTLWTLERMQKSSPYLLMASAINNRIKNWSLLLFWSEFRSELVKVSGKHTIWSSVFVADK